VLVRRYAADSLAPNGLGRNSTVVRRSETRAPPTGQERPRELRSSPHPHGHIANPYLAKATLSGALAVHECSQQGSDHQRRPRAPFA
jgi:hypothetical protein